MTKSQLKQKLEAVSAEELLPLLLDAYEALKYIVGNEADLFGENVVNALTRIEAFANGEK